MSESHLHARIAARSADLRAAFPQVLAGPGDDCAVVAVGGAVVLLTVDYAIEALHFAGPLGVGTPVDLAARKAIARSVSDIAAMGGTPTCALAAAALPACFPASRADELFDAMNRWARHWGCPLVGGDVATFGTGDARGPLTLAVTIMGLPHAPRGPVPRSGALPGDVLYVTGALGGSLASGRHLSFEPRLDEARFLCDTLGRDLHAMMDLSDGLGRDAARLAAASGVRAEFMADALPRHAGVASWREAAGDGEDYELLFAVAAGRPVPGATPAGTPITRIGACLAASPGAPACVVTDSAGARHDATTLGWEH